MLRFDRKQQNSVKQLSFKKKLKKKERILEWVAIPFSRGSSETRDQIPVSWDLQADSLLSEPPRKPPSLSMPISAFSTAIIDLSHKNDSILSFYWQNTKHTTQLFVCIIITDPHNNPVYWVYHYFNFVDEKPRLRKQIAQVTELVQRKLHLNSGGFPAEPGAVAAETAETAPPVVLLRGLFEGRNHLECYSPEHWVPGTWQMLKKIKWHFTI